MSLEGSPNQTPGCCTMRNLVIVTAAFAIVPQRLEKPYAKTAQHNGFRDSVLGSHCGARGWSNSAARCKCEQRDQGRATDDNATADQRNWTAPSILNGQHKRRERERFLSPCPETGTRSADCLP